jgi:TolA-binding protein
MYKTGSLLLVSIVAVALMAPPARSQSSRKVTLEDVTRDLLDLQNYVKEMQRTADTKNAETKAVLDQVLGRFTSIDTRLQKLSDSLALMKTGDEKSATELQQTRDAVKSLKDSLDKLDLGQTLLDIKNGILGVRRDMTNLQTTETALPTSRQAFDSAYTLYIQGFYDDAIAEFRDFVKAYGKDPRAAKAQLNIATAYFNQKQFDKALIEYDLAIQNYPESDTKCNALYKKGQTLAELKKVVDARLIYQSVVKECPNTEESNFAAAELKKPAPAAGRGARGNN